MRKIVDLLKMATLGSKKLQQGYIIAGIIVSSILMTCINPFATDGYEDISTMAELDNRVAVAVANHETELRIDYSGEDFNNMKSWFKTKFDYENLVSVGGEYAAYNYNGAKYTYWSYGDKKRVLVQITYKETLEEKAYVDAWAEDFIVTNGLREMSQYEAIKFVHDYLINNVAYVGGANSTYNVVVNKQANCYGYTMINYVVLDRLGINCRTTYGSVTTEHIWNVVNLGGQWYYEDVTWDTAGNGYSYFLVSTNKITSTHNIKGNFIVDCPIDYVAPKVDEVIPEDEHTEIIVPEDENTETIIPDNEETIVETPVIPENETVVETPIVNEETNIVENNSSVSSGDTNNNDTTVSTTPDDNNNSSDGTDTSGRQESSSSTTDNNNSDNGDNNSDMGSTKEEVVKPPVVEAPKETSISKLLKLLRTLRNLKK